MKQLLMSILLVLTGCVNGSHIITGNARPAFPAESVRLYLDPPSNYEKVGIVSATAADGNVQRATDSKVAELKKQAGMIGANGILLGGERQTQTQATYIPTTTGGIFIPSQNQNTMTGIAIFVEPNTPKK